MLVVGDEDEPCLETNIFLKRTIPGAGLWVIPNTGHAVNLEEPALFNRVVGDFFAAVERSGWPFRDPRSLARATHAPLRFLDQADPSSVRSVIGVTSLLHEPQYVSL